MAHRTNKLRDAVCRINPKRRAAKARALAILMKIIDWHRAVFREYMEVPPCGLHLMRSAVLNETRDGANRAYPIGGYIPQRKRDGILKEQIYITFVNIKSYIFRKADSQPYKTNKHSAVLFAHL